MRILFVLHQFFPEFGGGTERVALNLARMAQRAGHHVHVLASTVDPSRCGGQPVEQPFAGCLRGHWEGVPVTFIPRSQLPATADIGFDVDEALAGPIAGWMRAERFDVAHVLHTMRMSTAVLAAQRCGLPYVLTLTDFFLPCARINLVTVGGELCGGPEGGERCARDCAVPPWNRESFLGRFEQAQSMLGAAADRVAPSAYVARKFTDSFPGLTVRVIPHGVDLLPFADVARASAREAGAGKELRLAFAGAVVPQKGLHVLLQALALLPGRPVRLRAMGGFWGNPGYHREVRALAQADPRVELAGEMPPHAVFRTLSESDLLCLPSLIPESFSLAHVEASAAGIPALVSNLGAPADRIAQGGAGLAVEPGNPRAWADAIAQALDDPPQLDSWRARLQVPIRIEEEAFFYESLWRRARRAPA